LLQQVSLTTIKAVPYFGDEKVNGRGFKSNIYNFENSICILDDLCYPSHSRDCVLPIKLKMLSNLVAIFDQQSNMYWVIKNRFVGREGWHTCDEFESLVMKEVSTYKPDVLDDTGIGINCN
jgi:hypothetical protein